MRLVRSLVLSVLAAGALSACIYSGPYHASGAYYGSYGVYGSYPVYSGYGSYPGYKGYRGYPRYRYHRYGGCHHCGW